MVREPFPVCWRGGRWWSKSFHQFISVGGEGVVKESLHFIVGGDGVWSESVHATLLEGMGCGQRECSCHFVGGDGVWSERVFMPLCWRG